MYSIQDEMIRKKNVTISDAELNALMAEVEQNEMLKAPVSFKQQVLEKSKRADIQMVIHTQELSKGMQLFFYSLKIGAAAALALFLLFWMPQDIMSTEWGGQMTWLEPTAVESKSENEKTLSEKLGQGAGDLLKRLSEVADEWMNKEE